MKRIIFFAAFTLLAASLHAQNSTNEEINAARPNQNAASQSIPRGTVQIETGVLFEHEREDALTTNQWLFPTTEVRVGVFDFMEFNVFHQFIRLHETVGDAGERSFTGCDNLTFGTIIQLFKERPHLPRMGLSVNLTVPTGSSAFRSDRYLPEVLFAASHPVSEKFRLRGTLGWAADDEQPSGNGEYVANVSYNLTDKLTAFAELYGEWENLGEWVVKTDGGLTYVLGNHIQLDVSGGTGVNTEYYFVSSGFSIRLPR